MVTMGCESDRKARLVRSEFADVGEARVKRWLATPEANAQSAVLVEFA